jgi:hypothetical protein
MKKSKFSEEQVAFALRLAESGTPRPSSITLGSCPMLKRQDNELTADSKS